MPGTVLADVDRTINKIELYFVLNFFPFMFGSKSVGEKWMTHFRSLLVGTRLVVSLVSVASHCSGIQKKHSEADLVA